MTPTKIAPEAIDHLLSQFFQAEMRSPWPPAPLPQKAENSRLPGTIRANQDTSARARWSLAASIALLIGGLWCLSGDTTIPSRHITKARPDWVPNTLEGTTAKMPLELQMTNEEKARRAAKSAIKGSFELP